ncbi:hypothetical protein A1F94_002489 [Pyrenophora tritici-repentis]|uniref:Uncharacterized protein n=2 Tax=Pyrenophora tritici-repentis TaxID=45151 RepID=A0A2W1FNL3_9PLEO|nr:uncharacterized protein PTRG_11259 [Pyrenophora tritici-repentis Pt-1C-BFP]KAF7451379.1 hypothetical protein A1F99_031560 [Pyrenophora tritici-repentis]EDU44309.1 conserved hypothetical protein [Pyrenophora tritici-repentis Pt-1C-BFP]KAF7575515.1 hypothetical protein PtrM4_071390 [Pyrenophora tritici-repentis]KAG9385739.1 hypothetical protein A1F94_002489 [Pyrenophora tritici-repentis]KAI0575007.1 hypothetical protein Alg215_08287 [Pyrenophora tritici-repentis]
MPQLFDLPRELRDLIYEEILASSAPLPTLKDTRYPFNWCPLKQPPRGLTDYDCVISFQEAPPTCASFLACNRQINVEMMHAIKREKQKGQMCALMDCVVNDQMHHFTWLAVPLVKTEKKDASKPMACKDTPMSKVISSWATRLFHAGTSHILGNNIFPAYSLHFTTVIERLRIDIRLFDSSPPISTLSDSHRNSTAWAICAALSHIFDNGPDLHTARRVDFIGEVVLNLVPQANVSNASPPQSPDNANDSLFVPETEATPTELIRNELVEVWNRIWAADDFPTSELRARYYRFLLEKINRVRICVNGKTFRTRELAAELERGRAEMRRIQMR